ncbi:MAG: choline dehydrogenase [Rhodospirillales bacterium]|nr:MAG: choline dehydrogenase [Rhodospirillales bacterium]
MMGDWDYIVVGAGSAGCVLANRLSADPKTRVLLLEAGPRDRNPWLHIPVGYYRTMLSPLSWGYDTEPEPALGNRRIHWPRGKVLGGSSAINGLVYMRGQPADYDHWRQLGNVGWAWDDVLPYFIKSEDQERGASDLHGIGGPLHVSDIRDRREICEAFIAAAREVGLPFNDDFNGPTQEGVGYFQTTARNGLRCSSAAGYLKPIRGRANLKIETGALATALTFDGTRATGVRYKQGDRAATATARGEIVLCGGTVNSPQLLQLSGIGPADVLRRAGIDVHHDLRGVGRDLQDHLQIRSIYRLNRPISVNDDVNNLLRRLWIGLDYLFRRRGPLTFSAGHACLFAKVMSESKTPDLQFHFIPFSADKPGAGLHPWSGVTASVCQLRPESRGEITIRSPDPREHPRIVANYLSTEYDRRVLIEGLKLARRISGAPSFAKYVEAEIEPGSDRTDDAALLEHIRQRGTTIFHPTSTCRMGRDEGAVVDDRLRVRGLQGVRIADCSIMPTLVSGNTNAPAIMIGEKCADMMRIDAQA